MTKSEQVDIKVKIQKIIKEIIPFLFSKYDTFLPTESINWVSKRERRLNTQVPDYKLEVSGVEFKIYCDGHILNGSITGFLTAIGGLWGIARGKVIKNKACHRMLYATGVSMPSGDLLIKMVLKEFLNDFLELTCLLTSQKDKKIIEENELLLYQISRIIRYLPENEGYYEKLLTYFDKKLLETFYSFLYVPDVSATTHQAVIKKLAKSKYFHSKKALHRFLLVSELHGHIQETGSNLINVAKIFPAFLPLLDDPHPLVKDLMNETCDVFAASLFYFHAYKSALPLLDILIERGINLDINLARSFESNLALENNEVAKMNWEQVKKITTDWENAPPQHGGLHTTYPNYDFWQLFSILRVSKAHAYWASGLDPCKHVILRKKTMPSQEIHDHHLALASQYLAYAIQQMEEFRKKSNAFEVGNIFAELQVTIADVKQEDIYGEAGKNYVMQTNYVEHVLYKRSFDVESIESTKEGLFERIEGRHFKFVRKIKELENPAFGSAIGVEYFVKGEPLSHVLKTNINVYHKSPKNSSESLVGNYPTHSYLKMNNAFYWSFEEEEDKKLGNWRIEILVQANEKKTLSLNYSFKIV